MCVWIKPKQCKSILGSNCVAKWCDFKSDTVTFFISDTFPGLCGRGAMKCIEKV